MPPTSPAKGPLATLRERVPDRNLWTVYATTWVLATAYGLAISTTALVLQEREFSRPDIGATAVFFGAGIVVCAVPAGWLVRHFAARRVLLVSMLGYAISIAVFPYLPTLFALGVCRFFDGAFSVGTWVSLETLVLSRAAPEHKAFATSLYAISTALGYFVGGVGSFALLGVGTSTDVFLVAAFVAVVASGFAWSRLAQDPPSMHVDVEHHGAANLRDWASLAWRTKISNLTILVTGFFQAAVVLFLPFYLQSAKGMSERETTLVMPLSAAGMLVISNLAGRLGDKYGHLLVVRSLAVVGVLTLVSFTVVQSTTLILASFIVGGGSLASVTPLALALQGAIAKREEYGRATSLFNVFFACGLLTGPYVTGLLAGSRGDAVVLPLFIGLWSVLIVLTLVFRRDDPATHRGVS